MSRTMRANLDQRYIKVVASGKTVTRACNKQTLTAVSYSPWMVDVSKKDMLFL